MGILTDDMKRVVTEQRLCFAATVCADGTPNLSPKGTTAVWDDDHLVFVDLRSPGTVRNLERNPTIEINVVDPLVRKGYRFKGKAVVHKGGDVVERAIEMYKELGFSDYTERVRAVIVIAVEGASEVTSPVYDLGYSEDEVRAMYARRSLVRLEGLEPPRA